MSEVEQLVKMANQIAENFSFHEDSVARTSDHLRRFWAPSMRKLLIEFEHAGGGGLKPDVVSAIRQLAEEGPRLPQPRGSSCVVAALGGCRGGTRHT